MNGNGATARWLTVIVSLIAIFASIAFGVVRTSNRDKIQDLKNQVQHQQSTIITLQTTIVRFDERLKNIERQTNNINDINKKLDILLEELSKKEK